MRWASAIATTELADATEQTLSAIERDLGGYRADLVLIFVTDHYADGFDQLATAVSRRFPGAVVAGCTAGGAIGGGVEVEHRAALSIVAASLPNVTVTGLHLGRDQDAWPLNVPPATAVLVLPCPLSSPVEQLLAWIDQEWPDAVKVGGLASGGMSSHGPIDNALFLAGERHREGAVVITFDGDIAVDTIVAQGCRPIGAPMIVSKGLGNVVLELDGTPALNVLEKIHAELSDADRALCRHSLFLGMVPGPAPIEIRRRDLLIRNLIGCDRAAGALAVGGQIHVGQTVQFHLRDAATSAQDLDELLTEPHAHASGALLFSCVGRGQLLYGVPNHDSDAFHRVHGPVPLGGFFCNGEVGPVVGRTFLHGYTSAFALFRRRGAQA